MQPVLTFVLIFLSNNVNSKPQSIQFPNSEIEENTFEETSENHFVKLLQIKTIQALGPILEKN